jgi:hypothetical protein
MNKSDKLILELYRAGELPNPFADAIRKRFHKALNDIYERGKQLHEKQLAMERASIKCDEQEDANFAMIDEYHQYLPKLKDFPELPERNFEVIKDSGLSHEVIKANPKLNAN